MKQINIDIKLKEHSQYFISETNRILKIIRNNGTRFDIYQTRDNTQNHFILEQEIKMIVGNHIITPNKLLNEYPLPYLLAKTVSGMIKDRVLAEPEIYIVD